MSPAKSESALPAYILSRASFRGNEYAWAVDDIPFVINAAQAANLVNIGGQLQFRLPDGTCECYWIKVDTYKSVAQTLSWSDRVTLTADVASKDFEALLKRFNFVAEGRKEFARYFDDLPAQGYDPADFMWFVWYVLSENEAAAEGL